MPFSKIKICSAFLSISIVLAACESMGPELSRRLPLETGVDKDIAEQEKTPVFDQYTDQPKEQESAEPPVRFYPGTGEFVGAGTRLRTGEALGKKGKFTLNFDDADLGEVTKVILSDTLNKNYAINPKVGGRVTLQTSRPLTKEELIPALEMLLRMNGAALLRDKGLYRIEPASSALSATQSPQVGGGAGRGFPPGYRVQIIPLRYVGVAEMQKILDPLLPPKAIMRADTSRNLLMIAGTSKELENILETISIFDVDVLKGMSFGVYSLKNVDPVTVIAELEKLFGEGSDSPLVGMFRLIAIERLNAVLVITPQPAYLEQAKLWIDRLDKTSTAASGGVHVYKVKNADAVELATTLNEIFSGKKKKSEIPSASLAPGLKPKEIKGRKKKSTKTKGTSKKQISLADVGEVRIIADEAYNSVVIVATAQEYEVILGVIEKLDVVPLQVLIDATIVEVRLEDELRYGLQWFIRHGSGLVADDNSAGGVGTLNGLTLGDIASVIDPGFSYGFLSASDKVGALFEALARDNKLNVISSPSLMVLNNQEATIKVGDQISLRTSESVNTSSTTPTPAGDTTSVVTNQFQQRDTGVTLTVKPRVNPGGLVIMEIDQKFDSVSDTSSSAGENPDIFQRQINSTVAVQSEETLVLGGLISEQTEKGVSGIPILSKLPLIGALFARTEKSLTRNELVILITPRVVKNRKDARDVTLEFKRKLTGIYQEADADGLED